MARNAADLSASRGSGVPEILGRGEIAALILSQTGLTAEQLRLAYDLDAMTSLAGGEHDGAVPRATGAARELDGYYEPGSNLDGIVFELIAHLCRQELLEGRTHLQRECRRAVIDVALAISTFLERAVGDAAEMMADTIRFEATLALTEGLLDETTTDYANELITLARSSEYRDYLVEKYPMLVRRVRERMRLVAQAHALLIHRIVLDRQLIADHFGLQADDVHVSGLVQDAGDSHHGAQAVTIVEFRGQRKLVYKPRSVSAEVAFQRYLVWINGICARLGLRVVKCYDRGHYGWMEYVCTRSARSIEDVRAYYYRFGALIAAYNAIQGTDLHHDNLVASCDEPVLIDLETIFHPLQFATTQASTKASDEMPASQAGASVYFTGLVDAGSFMIGGQRSSPLAGPVRLAPREQALERVDRVFALRRIKLKRHEAHCVRYGGHFVSSSDYTPEIIEGFRYCYEALLYHRQALLEGGLERLFGDVVARVVVRETRKYAKLLNALNSAYAGESFHRQDEYLHKLWLSALDEPALARLTPAEIEDALRNDVPYFSARITSCDVADSQGRASTGLLVRSGMAAVKERLCQMSTGAMEREVACIEHALRPPAAAQPTTQPPAIRRARHFPARVDSFFDSLNAELHIEGGRVFAIDIAHCRDGHTVRHLPLGNDLCDGLPGLCFALAFHGHATGNEVSTANAFRLAQAFFARLDIEAHDYRIGAAVGLGGWVWLASQLASIWNSSFHLEMATMLARRLMAAHQQDRHHDLFSGAAGALLAIDTLYSVSRDKNHLSDMARLSHFLLAQCPCFEERDSKESTSGFAHGASGIGYSLLRAYERLRDPQLLAAAEQVHRFLQRCQVEKSADWLESVGGARIETGSWCHGAPGISLFYEKLHSISGNSAHRAALTASLRKTRDHLVLDNECLCHGTLGNAEVFLSLARSRRREDLARFADEALASIETSLHLLEGMRCGTPRRRHSLSLFNGFSGIGYQLLRLRYPEASLPAVLTFDPVFPHPGGSVLT